MKRGSRSVHGWLQAVVMEDWGIGGMGHGPNSKQQSSHAAGDAPPNQTEDVREWLSGWRTVAGLRSGVQGKLQERDMALPGMFERSETVQRQHPTTLEKSTCDEVVRT
ncbi:hypothetical protein NDU88_003459 [Pleurodeles waltl]|uniref:Uncharacterized protein n=1 Tax=Pleurodeles waltl TaxID=8319 RepID=A0AAV7UCL2_PLEWA|nr:hypothetical protein NDU88_003459 [Pleurodeles waltl]